MAVSVKKREGENSSAVVYRFTRKVQRSGVLREFRKRRFHDRKINRNKRRRSALHREHRRAEIEKSKKLGTFWK
jgi:ribosomal protein S21